MVVSFNARDGSNDTEDVGDKDGLSLGSGEGSFVLLIGSFRSVDIVSDGLLEGPNVVSLGIVEGSLVGSELGKTDFVKVGFNVGSLLGLFEGNGDGSIVGTFSSLLGTEVGSFVGINVGLDEGDPVVCSEGSLDGWNDGLVLSSSVNVGLFDGIIDVECCILGAFV